LFDGVAKGLSGLRRERGFAEKIACDMNHPRKATPTDQRA
jgi:hypothetical protein